MDKQKHITNFIIYTIIAVLFIYISTLVIQKYMIVPWVIGTYFGYLAGKNLYKVKSSKKTLPKNEPPE